MTRTPEVDVVVLSREASPLDREVVEGLNSQRGVRVHLHRVIGSPLPGDKNRWETIVRARNAARRCGNSPWLMFLDDDVALLPDVIARLMAFLHRSPIYAGAAADYLHHAGPTDTNHVSMGATLIRRHVLREVSFRWEAGRCECRCFCEDLRLRGWGIRYVPGAIARHLPQTPARSRAAENDAEEHRSPLQGHVLAAFDRRHLGKFRHQFLRSLLAAGNTDRVHVVGYGLYPSEASLLARLPQVTVLRLPDSRVMPPVRRLHDFQSIVAQLPPTSPVAYWDAADVFFQGSLQPLWRLVRETPDRILAVREPRGYPHNPAIWSWSLSIRDPACRQRAFELLQQNPFLNSGFAAGTAASLHRYFAEAHRLRTSPELAGTRDWGDQMALNIYCHSDRTRWREVEQGWNFCVHDRRRGEVQFRHGAVIARTPVHVVHGNAHSFRQRELQAW